MKVLYLSPHTDDVELGAGGTLVRHLEEGHEIHWMAFSSAVESVPEGMPPQTIKNEFLANVERLGIPMAHVDVGELPVRRFDEHRQAILESLVGLRDDVRPDLVVMPSRADVHQDHQVVANETVRAFKRSATILGYELPWNHLEAKNQAYVRLTEEHVARKLELLRTYESQYAKGRTYFDDDFVRGLAKTRGVQCGADFAEAFEVVRWIH